MTKYQVGFVATVYTGVEVEAENESEARSIAYDAIEDDYGLDFEIQSVFEVAE